MHLLFFLMIVHVYMKDCLESWSFEPWREYRGLTNLKSRFDRYPCIYNWQHHHQKASKFQLLVQNIKNYFLSKSIYDQLVLPHCLYKCLWGNVDFCILSQRNWNYLWIIVEGYGIYRPKGNSNITFLVQFSKRKSSSGSYYSLFFKRISKFLASGVHTRSCKMNCLILISRL